SILGLNDDSILEYLRIRKMIPNQEGSMVKPSNLYHADVELFRIVFGNAPDKLLSASFKGNSDSIQNLQKIGVNTSVDAKNFLKCAEYIAEQVKWTAELENDSTINLRVPALVALNYLYNNFSSLSFNDEQWACLELIEFVPVVPVMANGQRHKCCPMPPSGFGTLKNICRPEYRDISWTQLPIIDYNVIPRGDITRKYPHIGTPTPEHVLKHLKQISMKLDELVDRKDVYRIVKMIYGILDRTARNSDSTIGRWLKKAGTIFLNINEGEDPFDRKNWKAYSQLKFGATKQENDFIKEILQPYPELLKAAGVKNVRLECLPEPEDKQTNRFLTGILNLLSENPDVHDTVFDVKGEKFYANKYVLAANGGMFKKFLSSTHFKGSTPSDPAVHEISEMDPRSFEVFLSYLYGNMLNVSISSKWNVVEEESERVQLYLDLLWAANFYELIDLRDIVECRLSRYLTRTNVKIIKEYADKYEGKQLAKVCANYMKTNCQD
ncbi:8045_t:CDS:1, partial [Paraglomus occultum]